jgi:hypothetical protein
VYATTNTELFYLPVNRTREKLAALADGVAVARGDDPDTDRTWTTAEGDAPDDAAGEGEVSA